MVAFLLALACHAPEFELQAAQDSGSEGYDGHDELDEGYTGGWPTQADKEDWEAPELDEALAEEGAQLGRIVAMDQFGDFVDVYDFAGHDKPVVVEISAMWCGPCHELSLWLLGEVGYDSPYAEGLGMEIPRAVAEGEVLWITVMGEGERGTLTDPEELEQWYAAYPNERVPILGDDGRATEAYLRQGWPSVYLLDEDLRIEVLPTYEQHFGALETLDERLESSR